ncbi:tryptophan tryptophylquinone biosynthesis enzyme MauG [Methylobacterium sp. Leaf456]|uniref:cytochrome-c peroxidase n=1 Tax=Methylobacterium sp. Leaf456 TaxID=1736382 RepID=UPI0006F4EDDE|nr:cytochrome c peroxidase [Methylobacterium sp. Leaf456]KQT56168.1 tryptophan tryptophylquinone biosynthesis enzyme MauG [Methylobacterium sp. Leaf456]
MAKRTAKAAAHAAAVLMAVMGCAWAVGVAGEPADEADRAARLAEYRRPDAIPFPDDNPYSRAKAELGRALFFDTALSRDESRACATCHLPSQDWTDDRPRAMRNDDGPMAVRTPTLLDVAWIERSLGWDGRFRDLEGVAYVPITAPANMDMPEALLNERLNAMPAYVQAFRSAFPEAAAEAKPVTRRRIEQALATFQRLIVAGPAPFDAWVASDPRAVSPAAKRGFDLFTGKAGCDACHSGHSFTDGSFHDIGTASGDDIGRGRFFPNSTALRYAFKTPTLRNVARRPPYMHDGSVADLAAVVALYDKGGIERPSRSRDIRPLNLSAGEKADLIAFLETLTDVGADGPAHRPITEEPPRP